MAADMRMQRFTFQASGVVRFEMVLLWWLCPLTHLFTPSFCFHCHIVMCIHVSVPYPKKIELLHEVG
jgi:hypothetical protein